MNQPFMSDSDNYTPVSTVFTSSQYYTAPAGISLPTTVSSITTGFSSTFVPIPSTIIVPTSQDSVSEEDLQHPIWQPSNTLYLQRADILKKLSSKL